MKITIAGKFKRLRPEEYVVTLSDGSQVSVWKSWSRLGGEGWQTRHGGATYKNRNLAVEKEIQRRGSEARKKVAGGVNKEKADENQSSDSHR